MDFSRTRQRSVISHELMAEKGYIMSILTNRPVPSGAFDMLIGRDRTFQKSVIVSSPDEFHFLAGHDETISQTIEPTVTGIMWLYSVSLTLLHKVYIVVIILSLNYLLL